MRALPVLTIFLAFGCADVCTDHPICDIRLDDCQAAVWEAIQCERGPSSRERPPMHVITQDEYRAYLEDLAADVTPTAESAHDDAALQLLGLIPEDSSLLDSDIDELVADVIAFYTPSERTITVVDRGASMSAESDVVTLAHEMTHAIQDDRYDLSTVTAHASTVEESIVIGALIEGDATYHSVEYGAAAEGLMPAEVDWSSYFDRWRTDILSQINSSSPRYSLSRHALEYPLGGAWVASVETTQSITALDPLFANPPTSGLVVVADHLAGEQSRAKEPITCAVPAAPPGMSIIDEDALGPTIVFAFLAGGDWREAWEAARNALDDHLVVYGDGSGERTAVQWRIHTESVVALAPLISHAQRWANDPQHVMAQDGSDLVVAASNDASFAEWQEVALAPCAAP